MTSAEQAWCACLAGKTVGKFNLIEFVGAGRIGYVYKAQLRDLPSPIYRAVKMTFDELKPGWETELKKVMSLALVPGVVHFHDLGTEQITHDGRTRLCQYTVWDYISPGENLRQYLSRTKSIPTSFLLAVVERILHVLHACETAGVVRHGDLHAGNILIGDESRTTLDDSLQPRAPIYVSDFGYGATGGPTTPKDDYQGLAQIVNTMIPRVEYSTATATHRQILQALQRDFGRLLNEKSSTERRNPLELLQVILEIKRVAQSGTQSVGPQQSIASAETGGAKEVPSVGQFQVSEMIGDRWDWWKRLFVPTVPARSKILALDIPTVVTGPRGCGKTMLFRRLSERLIVECGEVTELPAQNRFVALYVNANDFADAFSRFPAKPSRNDEALLICYANLCVLGELLSVQSARSGRYGEIAPDALLALVHEWLVPTTFNTLIVGEDRLERYRALIEQLKWSFPAPKSEALFPGFTELSQHRWLPRFVQQARACCPWMTNRSILIFVDDFSTPRVSDSMQRVLNRLFLQRSPDFLAKLATEAWSTFVPEDSSGKQLQDGDDYQLVDIGEESLFLPDHERLNFLTDVFSRRLEIDARIPSGKATLNDLLGRMGLSKTEFARRLRLSVQEQAEDQQPTVPATSQRRGRSRGRVRYFGEDVFSDLWSGDTRTMIQLISDVIGQAHDAKRQTGPSFQIDTPVDSTLQDRVFRNRGGEWLNSHTRNEPTNPATVREELTRLKQQRPNFALVGQYGDHLKVIVEAFAAAATKLLVGPTYTFKELSGTREVPRMAFRIEIIDEFRIEGLALEIYRDLIRYGLFMRDSRGKSIRGAFVPRLYLRRLLLPYCTLALSKRDSVPLTCKDFVQLLLQPDLFKSDFAARRIHGSQIAMFGNETRDTEPDPAYDDLTDDRSINQQPLSPGAIHRRKS